MSFHAASSSKDSSFGITRMIGPYLSGRSCQQGNHAEHLIRDVTMRIFDEERQSTLEQRNYNWYRTNPCKERPWILCERMEIQAIDDAVNDVSNALVVSASATFTCMDRQLTANAAHRRSKAALLRPWLSPAVEEGWRTVISARADVSK